MNLHLTFMHHSDNSSIDVTIEDNWSANYAIEELIRESFLKPLGDAEEYRLVYKEDQTEFGGSTTFAQAGVQDGKVISVVVRPKAGGHILA